jgi:hypothetical protein
MDAITSLVIVFVAFGGALGLLGLAATRWGVDSRPKIGDTHAR